MPDLLNLKCGFLGAGQMATALAAGWTKSGLLARANILASDPVEAARRNFEAITKAPTTADNRELLRFADILVVAVKPQVLGDIFAPIVDELKPTTLVISIAAGVNIEKIASQLPGNPIIRVMPNTPCLVSESASGIAGGPTASADHLALVLKLFNAVGKAIVVPEKLMDAVTGLSGSGPAYVYLMIEALADGGVKMGLPREMAQMLAAQTVLGAAKMVIETKQHPGALKDAVCSPAGTTIAGMHELEKAGVRAALMNAVEAATKRATELGK